MLYDLKCEIYKYWKSTLKKKRWVVAALGLEVMYFQKIIDFLRWNKYRNILEKTEIFVGLASFFLNKVLNKSVAVYNARMFSHLRIINFVICTSICLKYKYELVIWTPCSRNRQLLSTFYCVKVPQGKAISGKNVNFVGKMVVDTSHLHWLFYLSINAAAYKYN